MQKRAYLGLGFLLALGILMAGLIMPAKSAMAQTANVRSFTVPAGGGTAPNVCGGATLTVAPGALPAGSTITVSELTSPPPGTTLPGVGIICDVRATGPTGQTITTFAGRVTLTGAGNACYILNEATGRFEAVTGTPVGGGQVECTLPRAGVYALVTVVGPAATATPVRATPVPAQAPGQAPGKAGAAPAQSPAKAGAAPAQAPGKAGAAPAQAPGKAAAAPGQTPGKAAGAAPSQAPGGVSAGTAPSQSPAALPRTGEELPVGGLAIAGLMLAGIGIATRRFVRRS
ncbi:MAG TPA: hypothetical protein VHL09_16135 [Dehalococcoidia bacterium]|nr:hypothetical protein [Dehalococcoidia bacterium]